MSKEEQKSESGVNTGVSKAEWGIRIMEATLSTTLFVLLENMTDLKQDIMDVEDTDLKNIKHALGAAVMKIVRAMEPEKKKEEKAKAEEQKSEEPIPTETTKDETKPQEETKTSEDEDEVPPAKLIQTTLITMAKYAIGHVQEQLIKELQERKMPEPEIVETVTKAVAEFVENPKFLKDPLQYVTKELKIGIHLPAERFFGSLESRFDVDPSDKNKIVCAMTLDETKERIKDISDSLLYIGKYVEVNVMSVVPKTLNPLMQMLTALGVRVRHTLDCGVCTWHWRTCLKKNERYMDATVQEATARENLRDHETNHYERAEKWNASEYVRIAKVKTMLSEEELAVVEENKYASLQPITEGADKDLTKNPKPSDCTMSDIEWDDAETLRVARAEIQKTGTLRPHIYGGMAADKEMREKLEKACDEARKRVNKIIVAYKIAGTDECDPKIIPDGCSDIVQMRVFNSAPSPFRTNLGVEYKDDDELIICPECIGMVCCKRCMYRNVSHGQRGFVAHANSEVCKVWKIVGHALSCRDPIKSITMISERREFFMRQRREHNERLARMDKDIKEAKEAKEAKK